VSKMQRTKGAGFERKVASMARAHGIPAQRMAPMQTQKFLPGFKRHADVEVGPWKVECKHHQKVSVVSYDDWTDSPGRVLVYQHNGRRPKVVMDYEEWLDLVRFNLELENQASAVRYPHG
jgi:hypothetical protein